MFEVEIVGVVGLAILVSVFLLHSAGRLRENSDLYFYGLNAVGAFLLTTYAISLPNVYFAVLESVWCVGAIVSGTRTFRRVSFNHHGESD